MLSKTLLTGAVMVTALSAMVPAHATQTTFQYNYTFSGTQPTGSAPWLTAVFDDFNTSGAVTLTVTAGNLLGVESIAGLYFNLDPVLDPSNLQLSYVAGSTAPGAVVNLGANCFRADGDGYYDVFLDFPPPPGNIRFNGGETVTYQISGISSLTADSFNFYSKPGPGSNSGPFLSAAHITGITTNYSGWIAPVPEASTWSLLGAGMAVLALVQFRRNREENTAV